MELEVSDCLKAVDFWSECFSFEMFEKGCADVSLLQECITTAGSFVAGKEETTNVLEPNSSFLARTLNEFSSFFVFA